MGRLDSGAFLEVIFCNLFIYAFFYVLLKWRINFHQPLLLTECLCSLPRIYCVGRNCVSGHWGGAYAYCQSTIDSEGFKGGTRGAPIMPRDAVSRTANAGTGGTCLCSIYCMMIFLQLRNNILFLSMNAFCGVESQLAGHVYLQAFR